MTINKVTPAFKGIIAVNASVEVASRIAKAAKENRGVGNISAEELRKVIDCREDTDTVSLATYFNRSSVILTGDEAATVNNSLQKTFDDFQKACDEIKDHELLSCEIEKLGQKHREVIYRVLTENEPTAAMDVDYKFNRKTRDYDIKHINIEV